MCGIFAYKGKRKDAYNILLHGLERLEYRGYDSAGMAVVDKKGKIHLFKSVGKVANLTNNVTSNIISDNDYYLGIAHTRWATHGGVCEENAHPHYSSNNKFYVVHNGIIENYSKLKKQLEDKGYKFYSQTDTEIVAKLIEDNWTGDLLKTVEKILPILEGAYAFVIISKENPGEVIGVKYGSPLIFGYTDEGEFFFSSDTQALVGYVENIIFLDDGDLVYVKNNDYILKSEGKLVIKPIEKIDVDSLKAEKGEFEHYMLKEIFDQPNVINDIFRGRVDFQNKILTSSAFQDLDKNDFKKVVFVACGTSYHAGWLGQYWFEDLAEMDAQVRLASEFEYKNLKVSSDTLYIFISQSGETADTIETLKMVKNKGGKTFGIVNVVGSSISRLTDYGMFTRAGTEVGVASTKAFVAQITTLLLLALYFGNKGGLSNVRFEKIIKELAKLPGHIDSMLSNTKAIQTAAKKLSKYKNFFYLGRHYQLPIAYEGSLKLKEISYLHSESYASGELKHGPLALIDESMPSVLLCPNDFLLDKNISTIHEIKARKGFVLTISDENIDKSDLNIQIPKSIDELYPFFTVVVSQLLAYYVANILGKEIDKPRNLAKSVTVK